MNAEKMKVLHVVIKGDHEDIAALYEFMEENDIIPLRTMSTGAGRYDGLFEEKDSEKIEAWLERHGDFDECAHCGCSAMARAWYDSSYDTEDPEDPGFSLEEGRCMTCGTL